MKQYRLNRLFNGKSGRCLDVAIDHGFFNEFGFLKSIENMKNAIGTVVEAETEIQHKVLTAALESHKKKQIIKL